MEEIFIPATGMAMEQAELVEWLKQPGESVAAGEPVAVIETDKAATEVVAATAGILSRHLHPAGANVGVGQPIVYILAAGEIEPGSAGAGAGQASDNEAPPPVEAVPPRAGAAPTAADGADVGLRTPHTESPRQRRLEREATAAAAAVALAAPGRDRDRGGDRADRAREFIGRSVTESWTTIPHFAVSGEIDVTDLIGRLAQLRARSPLVSMTDLLLRVSARAWSLFRAEAEPVIGMSVATDRGVINVSVPGAATGDVVELAARRRAAVDRARRGRLTTSDLAAPSITLSNLGTHGVDWFTGIIPLQQLVLVTVGRARRAVVVEGDVFRIRDMMWVTVNLDHRHLDGADGARLLELIGEQGRELT